MNGEDYQVVVTGADGSVYQAGPVTFEEASRIENAVNFALEMAGGQWDELEQVWKFADGHEVEVLLIEYLDEEAESPWSEAEKGWRNIHEEELAKVRQQVIEDAEYEARERNVPYYQGVRGVWQEDGWIFEP